MENIRDPALRQMIEDFKQGAATINNYHRLALGQALFDQMHGKRFKEKAEAADAPPAQSLTVLTGCRRLLVKVCQRVIQALDEPHDGTAIVAEAQPGEQERDVVDAPYTIQEEQPSPARRKAPVWDN